MLLNKHAWEKTDRSATWVCSDLLKGSFIYSKANCELPFLCLPGNCDQGALDLGQLPGEPFSERRACLARGQERRGPRCPQRFLGEVGFRKELIWEPRNWQWVPLELQVPASPWKVLVLLRMLEKTCASVGRGRTDIPESKSRFPVEETEMIPKASSIQPNRRLWRCSFRARGQDTHGRLLLIRAVLGHPGWRGTRQGSPARLQLLQQPLVESAGGEGEGSPWGPLPPLPTAPPFSPLRDHPSRQPSPTPLPAWRSTARGLRLGRTDLAFRGLGTGRGARGLYYIIISSKSPGIIFLEVNSKTLLKLQHIPQYKKVGEKNP